MIQYPDETFQLFEHMLPHIRISPFLSREWDKILQTESVTDVGTNPKQWLNDANDMDYYDSGRKALLACLRELNLKSDDEVLIVTTTNGPYISGCVTKTIEDVCQWKREKSANTKLVLVIHEFGVPLPFESVEQYRAEGIPILEDNCYAFGTRLAGGNVGTYGDYAIYSLPKYYPIPFGGILLSKKELSDAARALKTSDDAKALLIQTVNKSQPDTFKWNIFRQAHWDYFSNKLAGEGFGPYFQLTHKDIPGVYLTKVPKDFPGEEVKARLTKAGIEATQYYNQGGFYFPIHQFLTEYDRQYILHQFLNLTENR